MRILSLLIFCFLLISLNQQTDSPHGRDFKVSCKTCHSPKGWQIDKEVYSFDHNTTKLASDRTAFRDQLQNVSHHAGF